MPPGRKTARQTTTPMRDQNQTTGIDNGPSDQDEEVSVVELLRCGDGLVTKRYRFVEIAAVELSAH